MNTKEFKTLVETLGLEDNLKNKVLEVLESQEKRVPDEWDDETHRLREVTGVGGNYLLIQEDDAYDFRAVPLDKDGGFKLSEGTYISKNNVKGFTGRKMVLVRSDIPDNVEDIEPGERFIGEYEGEERVITRRGHDEVPWSVHSEYQEDDYAFDFEVKLLRRLVEV